MENFNDILNIDPKAKTKLFKRGEILQRENDTNTHTFFVKKGLLRSYIIDSKGKEHIFMFAPEGWIIADVESLEFNEPAGLFIDCLEDSELIIFDRECLFKADLTKETVVKNFKLLYRRMGVLQRRIIMQMSAPAIDRYSYFLKTYSELINRIPQHMIASYLGITPQALSTIRSKMVKSN